MTFQGGDFALIKGWQHTLRVGGQVVCRHVQPVNGFALQQSVYLVLQQLWLSCNSKGAIEWAVCLCAIICLFALVGKAGNFMLPSVLKHENKGMSLDQR